MLFRDVKTTLQSKDLFFENDTEMNDIDAVITKDLVNYEMIEMCFMTMYDSSACTKLGI